MTLPFSTQLNGKETYFPHKILFGLERNNLISFREYSDYIFYCPMTDINKGKIHTMRVDEHDRWKAGTLIHFVINNRTPNRYQFAPVCKCISTQKIVIAYFYNKVTDSFGLPMVHVDGRYLVRKEVEELAINDGFGSAKAFFAYFKTDWSGKLIHWTNKKY